MYTHYMRGKDAVGWWCNHWLKYIIATSRTSTVEAELVEYGCSIRQAFSEGTVPNIVKMTPYLKATHRIIMEGLPADQRDDLLLWSLGEDEEIIEAFGVQNREPSSIKALYKKIGRKLTKNGTPVPLY